MCVCVCVCVFIYIYTRSSGVLGFLAQPSHVNSHRLLVIHTLCGYNNGAQRSDVTTAGIPRRPRSAPPPPPPRVFSATLH